MERIPVQQTQLVPEIVVDYLNQKLDLSHFYSQPNLPASYAELKKQRQYFSPNQRLELHSHLVNQYQNAGINLELTANHSVQEQLNSLLQPQGYTVCTGHQLVLFGGPLFTTYKILTAIKLARTLSLANPSEPVIPIFWLASEDHDFEEIQTVKINGNAISLNLTHDANPVGELMLQKIEQLIEELTKVFPQHAFANELLSQIKRAYQNGTKLAVATLKYYHELYAAFGLVILDANSPTLKQALIPIIKKDLLEQFHFQIQKDSDTILAKQYNLQINARPFNFFYINEAGKRFLIKQNSNHLFQLSENEKDYTAQELTHLIENFPERFSPNVNLRPIFQELILPNLAYIGGPAEIAYWLQLKPIFDAYKLSYPILVLRHMQAFVPNGFAQSVKKFNLNLSQLILPIQELELVFNKLSDFPGFEKELEIIDQNWQTIYDAFLKLNDQSAKDLLQVKLKERTDSKLLLKKFNVLRKEKLKSQFDKLLKLRSLLYPNGVFQERTDLLISYEATRSTDLKEAILNEIDPFDPCLLFFTA